MYPPGTRVSKSHGSVGGAERGVRQIRPNKVDRCLLPIVRYGMLARVRPSSVCRATLCTSSHPDPRSHVPFMAVLSRTISMVPPDSMSYVLPSSGNGNPQKHAPTFEGGSTNSRSAITKYHRHHQYTNNRPQVYDPSFDFEGTPYPQHSASGRQVGDRGNNSARAPDREPEREQHKDCPWVILLPL